MSGVLTAGNDLRVEILISTMNRTSLFFLKDMFPHNKLEDLLILIINQTEEGKELISEFTNVRVINSFEKGLSKSRNLAVKNAIGDICLIADDDVEYIKNFDYTIKETFLRLNTVSIIKFKIDTFEGKDYKKYPITSKFLYKKKDIRTTSSIEIAFKRKEILKNNILFNTLFGLGSHFQSGEEYLFLSNALKKNRTVYFENKVIVKHSLERSTTNMGSDKYIKTQAALYYYDYKSISYLFLMKLIFFLLRKRMIKWGKIINKYNVGLCGINEYKKLVK